MLVYQRDPEGKPPFSYGFPMVFIINRTKSAASKVSGDVQRRCTSLILGSAGRRKKTACLVKKGGNHGENHGKTMGLFWGKLWGTQKKKPMGFCQTCRRFQKMFFPFNQWDYRKQVMPIERRIERHLWHRFGPLLSFSQCFIQTSCKCHMNFVLL